jgi:DNA-binding NarL/FixJ family response regulator
LSRLLIIGSHGFTADAVQFALVHLTGLSLLAIADSSADVAAEVRRARPEIVVLDGISEDNQVLEWLPEIRAEAEGALLLVVVDDVTAAETAHALDAGAVLVAWPVGARQRIREGRQEVGKVQRLRIAGGAAPDSHRGAAALTRRELETLRWVAEGKTSAWIARKLWVTEQTVKFHLTNIYRKLGVANRTEASHYAIRHGLVPTPAATPTPRAPHGQPTMPAAHAPAVDG